MKHCPFCCVSGEFKVPSCDSRTLRANIAEQMRLLREIIQLDDGFLDILFELKILSDKLLSDIKQSRYNKSDILLRFLSYRYEGDYSKVIMALAESGQQHVANFVISAGGRSAC